MATLFAGVDVDSIVPLTMQQVYDNALNGVVKQGRFSVMQGQGCFYNHPENPSVHCGIGQSIPPDWRAPEGVNVSALIRHDPRIERLFFGIPGGFLTCVQSIHDMTAKRGWTMSDFKEEMKKVARMFNLTYTEPTT